MAFISYTERPISALSSIGEARARLIWVDFNFVMSQQPPMRWSLNSWAAQANHGHPNEDPRILDVLEGLERLAQHREPGQVPGLVQWDRLVLEGGFDFCLLVPDVGFFVALAPDKIELVVTNEIPSDDWTWNICFDGLELVGLAPYFDHDVLAAKALDVVAVDGLQANVGVDLISRIRWPGADLGPGIDQDFGAFLPYKMWPHVDPLMAHCP